MNNILKTHRAEIARALRNHKYERTESGVLFTKQKLMATGAFVTRVNGEDERIDPNMVVNQGLDDVLNVYFGNVAKRVNFYLAPFSGSGAITAGLTAATFPGTQTEFTNYTESGRVAWTAPTTTSTQSLGNTASPARFTIGTGGGTIWGAAMTTVQTKSSTSGVLVAASLFSASRVLLAADKLDIEYILTASDSP